MSLAFLHSQINSWIEWLYGNSHLELDHNNLYASFSYGQMCILRDSLLLLFKWRESFSDVGSMCVCIHFFTMNEMPRSVILLKNVAGNPKHQPVTEEPLGWTWALARGITKFILLWQVKNRPPHSMCDLYSWNFIT